MGEIGLDFAHGGPSRISQRQHLRELLKIARRRNLPVIIHCRDKPGCREASDDCLKLLKEAFGEHTRHTIIRHCFDGDMGQFLEWKEAFSNCYFSISGKATHLDCDRQLSLVITKIPKDRLLLETDAPWLLPTGSPGDLNSPNLLLEIAKYILSLQVSCPPNRMTKDPRASAKLRELLEQTSRNSRRCFNI